MSLLTKLEFYLSERGRFTSFPLHMIGYPILLMGASILCCLSLSDFSARNMDPVDIIYFLWILLGVFCLFFFKAGKPRASVGVLTIVIIYILVILMAAVPYMTHGFEWKKSIFEAASGITTTGMTVLDIGEMGTPLIMWRAITGWLGGLFFITLFSLYISEFGLAGRYLFTSGNSSVDSDVYKPKVMKIAVRYLEIYLASTVVMALLLKITGIDMITSSVLALSTVSTTGFTTAAGIGDLSSVAKMIIALFMAVSMFNFTTTFVAVTHRSFRPMLKDNETIYVAVWLTLIGIIGLVLLQEDGLLPDSFKAYVDYLMVLFSAASTTGFVVHDFAWSSSMVLIMCLAAIVGGSIDSPTGGLKVARMAIALKIMKHQVNEVAFPNEVYTIRIRNVNVSRDLAYAALLTILIFLIVLVGGTILISFTELDMESALFLATSALTTTGPGLYTLGSMSDINTFATYVCFALMIIGRLEAVLFVMMLTPDFWRDLFSNTNRFRWLTNGRRPRFLSRLGSRDRRR